VKTSDFDYPLPPERIAQTPVEPRHASRLLVLERATHQITHTTFWNIADYLHPGDLLVVNQTRVIRARLLGHKESGGKAELLLLSRQDASTWEALAGGKGLNPGRRILFEHAPSAEILADLSGSRRLVRFSEPIEPYLELAGQVPLPPYIHTPLANQERYQTVYARQPGSAAAPTAGLHFTPELIALLQTRGIGMASLTLHVGLDTFAPVTASHPHRMVRADP
jgi:S-adenosylmethionine:tRNA ribosyltransferase-isomerase